MYRKCTLKGGQEISFEELRVGDVFKLEGDDKCPNGWYVATSEPKSCKPDGNFEIVAEACND